MIALLSLGIWLYLFFAHGWFWRSGPELRAAVPGVAPAVDIVVPARDEAQTIVPVIASLLAQDYAGRFRIVLVDDESRDDTARLAGSAANLVILSGRAKPPGWSGKLWALSQGVAAGTAPMVLLADADIVHDPRHLATLVARLDDAALDMVSEMVRLNCNSRGRTRLGAGIRVFLSDALSVCPRQRSAVGGGRRGRRDRADPSAGARANRRHRSHQGCTHRRCHVGPSGQTRRRHLSRPFGSGYVDSSISAFFGTSGK